MRYQLSLTIWFVEPSGERLGADIAC